MQIQSRKPLLWSLTSCKSVIGSGQCAFKLYATCTGEVGPCSVSETGSATKDVKKSVPTDVGGRKVVQSVHLRAELGAGHGGESL